MISGADEGAHAAPSDASWWWETWHLDVATEDGVGLSVRLACLPGQGIAWWWTHLLLPDLPGPVVVRDHEVGMPRQGLEVRADGLWGELFCETPFEHWTYGLEAFGVRLDDPADSLHGEIGERMPVGLDIEWEASDPTPPHAYGATREPGYEQFGVVHGEILLARSRFELDAAVGLRSHAWGVPRFDRPVRAAWLHSPALAMSFEADEGDRADGFVATAGESEASIASVRTETRRRADGLPVSASHRVDDGDEIGSEILGLVALPLAAPTGERAVLARALCRYEHAGQRLIGWSSWLDPD